MSVSGGSEEGVGLAGGGQSEEALLGKAKMKAEDPKSPEIKRSMRKTAHNSRGRLKSRPISPLLRMAEMRKGGLMGRALRQSGKRGFDDDKTKDKKGKKESGRRNFGDLETIPEARAESLSAVEEVEGSAGALHGDEVAVMLEDNTGDNLEGKSVQGSGDKQDWIKESIPEGNSSDFVLDLVAAQPLQEMNFVMEQVVKDSTEGEPGSSSMVSMGSPMAEKDKNPVQGEMSLDEDFPPLSKESLRNAREKGKNKGMEGKEDMNKEGNRGGYDLRGQNTKVENQKRTGGKNYKDSLADGVYARGSLPVSFEPAKIAKIGVTGESSGLPSIHFSGAETSYLADKLGYAIVGKFSHSFPSSLQIQRALQGMKFMGEYSWKYINAKHILVQFKLINDYAKLLSGPNGMPVWFVDRHPMRVFKWTPEFDPFFESPIAAVWCNLIGLPIHLFEKSALFAIGSLLGEPLQVDHATISRSRLSFARMCIEIDISQTPVREIILNLQGKEVRQIVKWDRIPLYCHDCKHVGHTIDACYANGQKEKPAKRNYNQKINTGLMNEKEGGVRREGNMGLGGMLTKGWGWGWNQLARVREVLRKL